FGMGLVPVWPMAWLFPLPVLAFAYRAPARATIVVAIGAWIVGSIGWAVFLRGALRVPIPIVAMLLLVPGVLFAGVVLLSRALLHRGAPWSAALAVPAAWTTGEVLTAVTSPHGTAGSFAYSQADVLPVVQLASVTGLFG